MAPAEAIHATALPALVLDGQAVPCRLVPSKAARKLRIRVRPDEVEVVLPEGREPHEAVAFLEANHAWVIGQLSRARRLQSARRPDTRLPGQVLFRGEPVPVRVTRSALWRAPNRVTLENGEISITCAAIASTPPARSLENWLRKQARERIEAHIAPIGKRLKRHPGRIYVMGQRTKWGNCSGLGNLSFNWRLVMAPDHVLEYIVTHEMVHLAVPDHSPRFWLTVQSLCPQSDRARQWLVAHAHRLMVDLGDVLGGEPR
jgi:predicted metal-dependent hydrolase